MDNKKINYMTFDASTPEGRAVADDFIRVLLNYNQIIPDMYNEIHIYQEEQFIKVEFIQVPFSKEYGGQFVFTPFNSEDDFN